MPKQKRKQTTVKWKSVRKADVDELLDELGVCEFGQTSKGGALQDKFLKYIKGLGVLRLKARECIEIKYRIQIAAEEYAKALNEYERYGKEAHEALVRLFQKETSASRVMLDKLTKLMEVEARAEAKRAGLKGTIDSLYAVAVNEQRSAIKEMVRKEYEKHEQ